MPHLTQGLGPFGWVCLLEDGAVQGSVLGMEPGELTVRECARRDEVGWFLTKGHSR